MEYEEFLKEFGLEDGKLYFISIERQGGGNFVYPAAEWYEHFERAREEWEEEEDECDKERLEEELDDFAWDLEHATVLVEEIPDEEYEEASKNVSDCEDSGCILEDSFSEELFRVV